MGRSLSSEKQPQYQVGLLLGPLLEALLDGIYFYLFSIAFPRLVKREALATWHGKISFVANAVMLFLATVHGATSGAQMLTSFALASTITTPLEVVRTFYRGALFSGIIVTLAMLLIGESLMIYRCFIIWQRQYKVIVAPVFLFLLSNILHGVNLSWARHAANSHDVNIHDYPLYAVPFSLHSAQSIITTALIVFRLWSELSNPGHPGGHCKWSRRLLRSIHVPSIISIIRIILESAMIYTMAVLAMLVMMVLDHPGQYITHCCMAPTTGIAFVLMTVRTQGLRAEAQKVPVTPSALLSWPLEMGDVTNLGTGGRRSDYPMVQGQDQSQLCR